jgi:hypothetical protein
VISEVGAKACLHQVMNSISLQSQPPETPCNNNDPNNPNNPMPNEPEQGDRRGWREGVCEGGTGYNLTLWWMNRY